MGEWESIVKFEKNNSCNNKRENITVCKNLYVVGYLNTKVVYLVVGA